MKKTALFFAASALLTALCVSSYADEPYTVTDVTGRQVTFQSVPKKALSLGHGALQLFVYVCGPDRLAGIEKAAAGGHSLTGQTVHLAFPELRNLPVVGKGGPKFAPDYEQMAYQAPDVIFMVYGNTKDELDEFQKKVNVPVVGLASVKGASIFSEDANRSFEIIGETMGESRRAAEIVDFIKTARADLTGRVASVPKDGQRVYLGGCSFRGEQGILSTKSHADLLTTVRANNVMDSLTDQASVMIDREKLLDLDPDFIIVDLSGRNTIREDMKSAPDFYKSLKAFQTKNTFAILPYFTYGMNYDTAILDLYAIGKAVHPEVFQDVDLEKKAGEIYNVFVGKNVYADLLKTYPESFQPVTVHE